MQRARRAHAGATVIPAGPGRAMGARLYDGLTISNGWARVEITRHGPRDFRLSYDGQGVFTSAADAVAAAWRALASFERGRFD